MPDWPDSVSGDGLRIGWWTSRYGQEIFLWHNTHSPQYLKKRTNAELKGNDYLMVHTEMEQHAGS
jgi:hypothetical protein